MDRPVGGEAYRTPAAYGLQIGGYRLLDAVATKAR